MAEAHLSQEEFLNKLVELFQTRKGSDHGAVYLTQKRLSYGEDTSSIPSDATFPDLHPSHPLPVLVRATNGKSSRDRTGKIKISTVVQPHELGDFSARYADVCKTGMVALKPRDRSKKKAKAKKKKTTAS